jgi:hypothetical protein
VGEGAFMVEKIPMCLTIKTKLVFALSAGHMSTTTIFGKWV